MRLRSATFRPAFGRGLTIAISAVVVLFLVLLVVDQGPTALIRGIWPGLLATVAAWAVFWRPAVVVDEPAVIVRNVFRTHRIPWAAIQRIDTKWALTLFTGEGRIGSWAAPAPSRYAAASVDPNDLRIVAGAALSPGRAVRPGDTLGTASGAAAFVINRHWNELRDDGRLDVEPDARRVRSTWNVPIAAALAALVAATSVAALI